MSCERARRSSQTIVSSEADQALKVTPKPE
jgi:hypothetical protein